MLRPYEAFLLKRGAVKPLYVPFYLKWVSDCYSFLDVPLSSRLSSEQKKEFLSNMERRHEEWQVRQADTGVEAIMVGESPKSTEILCGLRSPCKGLIMILDPEDIILRLLG